MEAGGGDGDGNGVCFPYDVLVDILRRLPARALARSRRICRAWRAMVDAHDLLLLHYFPGRVFPGIFVTKIGCESDSAFFGPRGRRRATAAADGPVFRRPVFEHSCSTVHHSCNGLLLLKNYGDYYVCNPATVRCSAPLRNPPLPPTRCAGAMFLAFDPAVSLHYEVFFFQEEVPPPVPETPTWVELEQTYITRLFGEEQLSEEEEQDDTMDMEQTCLPKFNEDEQSDESGDKTDTNNEQFGFPSGSNELEESLSVRSKVDVSPLNQSQEQGVEELKEKVVPFTVYSSRTGRWENREFRPGCCAPGHLYDKVTTLHGERLFPRSLKQTIWSSEYWRESLYMHCHNSVLTILRPSKGTYDMVELPGEPCGPKGFYTLPTKSVLASYERGIHYVAISQLQLQVWMLTESIDTQLGWNLSHEVSLSPHCRMIEPLTIKPRVTWGVVESSDDKLVRLFEYSDHRERVSSEKYCEDHMTYDENYDGVEEGDEEEELGSRCSSEDSWNSDEDNFIDMVEGAAPLGLPTWHDRCEIMGFHPHKPAVILQLMRAVVVYHLDTLKMQYLGDDYELVKDNMQPACAAYGSFPYRPCYVDALPAGETSVQS